MNINFILMLKSSTIYNFVVDNLFYVILHFRDSNFLFKLPDFKILIFFLNFSKDLRC